MSLFDWNDEKNEWLERERGLTFEDVIFHLTHEGLLDTIERPNQKQYPGQRIFVINVDGYACVVPDERRERHSRLRRERGMEAHPQLQAGVRALPAGCASHVAKG